MDHQIQAMLFQNGEFMSASTTPGRTKRKRGMTRRVTDKHGNIIVKRYTKKAARFTIPWNKLPQLLVGLPISLYSLGAYLEKEDRLDDYGLESLSSFYNWEGIFGLLLAGSIGFGLTAFLGYSFLTKGFNLKKWPRSFRELVAIWMGSIIVTALISPFLTEPGLTRQQTDDEFVPNDGNVDLTGLSSPFYASLLNGLLDLLGNIPTPLEEVGFVTDNDGEGFDYDRDRYLYRWRVAETYSTELQDFEQAFLSQTNDYRVYEDFQSGDPDQQRALTIEEQYLTISSGYLGEALTPWNSLEGATIGETDSIDARIVNEGSFAGGTSKSFTDINEQPILQASFSAARTQGFLTYDAYWVAEDKETLAANSILYDDLQDTLKDYDKTRFGDLDAFDQVTNNPFDAIWGLGSLPGIDRTAYITGDSGTFSSTFNANGDGIGPFERKYNDLATTLTSETTIYNFILLLANQMQSTILKGLTDGSLSIDPTQTSGVADPAADKAYWFFDAVDDNQEQGIQFGMKELLAGYVNILRAFGIPARPIIGFSVGDTMNDGGTPGLDDDSRADDTTCKSSDCDYIQILFKHLHVWVEALIPWVDNNGDMQFSWGILNPIPDPWILGNDQTDLEYGRNALGGSAEVELELLSGSETNLGESLDIGPLGTVDSFSIQNFGETVDGQTRVLFEDTPTGGQDVDLRLFTQADIDALGTDPDPLVIFDAGLSIAAISTDPDDPDGWGDFSLRAERNGDLFFINPDLSEDQVLNDDNSPFVVEAIDFLALDIADTNIYILVAIYGLSANVVALAWDLSVLITLELDQIVPGDPLTFPNPTDPLETITAYSVLQGQTRTFTVTITDNQTVPLPIVGETQLNLHIMTQTAFSQITTDLSNGVLDTSSLVGFVDTFAATDIAGQSDHTMIMDVNQYDLEATYVAIVIINGTIKFGEAFIWFSADMVMSSSINITDPGDPIIGLDASQFTFIVTTFGESFTNSVIVPNQPATQVNLTYYLIDQNLLGLNNVSYSLLNTNVLASCVTSGLDLGADCLELNSTVFASISVLNITGDFQTGDDGFATVMITVTEQALGSGFWVIVIVAHDFNSFSQVSRRFGLLGSQGLMLNSIPNNNYNNQVGVDQIDIPVERLNKQSTSRFNQFVHQEISTPQSHITLQTRWIGAIALLGLIGLRRGYLMSNSKGVTK